MKDHAILQCYGMLVHVSAGYLPVRGWLHTCYSPVRRSPAKYCYSPLPLDLHVLSLSLAFILSQDQTLHGKSYLQKFCSGRVMCFLNLDYRRFRFTLATFCSFQYLKELFFSIFISPSPDPLSLRSESGCKGKACFSFSKLFKLFFQTFFPAPRLTSFPRALSLESGCKDKAMIPPFPNFFTIIFHLFFKPPTNTVTGKTLGRKIFTGKTGKTTGKREGKAARPGKGTALSPGKHLSWTPVNVFDSSLIRI